MGYLKVTLTLASIDLFAATNPRFPSNASPVSSSNGTSAQAAACSPTSTELLFTCSAGV